jgi:hypothetical protein
MRAHALLPSEGQSAITFRVRSQRISTHYSNAIRCDGAGKRLTAAQEAQRPVLEVIRNKDSLNALHLNGIYRGALHT